MVAGVVNADEGLRVSLIRANSDLSESIRRRCPASLVLQAMLCEDSGLLAFDRLR